MPHVEVEIVAYLCLYYSSDADKRLAVVRQFKRGATSRRLLLGGLFHVEWVWDGN